MRKALSLLIAVFALTQDAVAQQPAPAAGRIIGRVVDGATGAGLSAISVQVLGTPIGTLSGLDGRFIINNVPSGNVTLRASSIGYASKSVTDVQVSAGEAV